MTDKGRGDPMEFDEDDDGSSVASASTDPNGTSRSTTPNPANRLSRSKSVKRTSQKPTRIQFRYTSHVKEDHSKAIFGVAFNHHLSPHCDPVFGTVGFNRVSVYKCSKDGSMEPQFVFTDPDAAENYYSISWSYVEEEFVPILAFAGEKGIIRVVYCYPNKPMPIKTFTGHGNAVNEVKFHPTIPALLFSASKDHSVRLWNTKTTALVSIFGGVDGHRDEVLGLDVNTSGTAIVSCGLDHSLKIWRLDVPEVQKAIKASFSYRDRKGKVAFETLSQHYPDFSTREVHHNYVDCVAWHGDTLVSKSCEHDLKFWRPAAQNQNNNDVWLMHEINVRKKKGGPQSFIWFVKFGFDFHHRMLALGDGKRTLIYDLDVEDPMTITTPSAVLSHPKCDKIVRVTVFSFDGDILISAVDDGSIFRWDRMCDDVWVHFVECKDDLCRITLNDAFRLEVGRKLQRLVSFEMDATNPVAQGTWEDVAAGLGMSGKSIQCIKNKVYAGGLTREWSTIDFVFFELQKQITVFKFFEVLKQEGRFDILEKCHEYLRDIIEANEKDHSFEPNDDEDHRFLLRIIPSSVSDKQSKFVLIFAAEDGYPLAKELTELLPVKTILPHSPESDAEMFTDCEAFALSSFRTASFIVPIVTTDYIRTISTKKRLVEETFDPRVKVLIRFHRLLDAEVVGRNGSARVRPLVARDVVKAHSHALNLISYLITGAWVNSNQKERLAESIMRQLKGSSQRCEWNFARVTQVRNSGRMINHAELVRIFGCGINLESILEYLEHVLTKPDPELRIASDVLIHLVRCCFSFFQRRKELYFPTRPCTDSSKADGIDEYLLMRRPECLGLQDVLQNFCDSAIIHRGSFSVESHDSSFNSDDISSRVSSTPKGQTASTPTISEATFQTPSCIRTLNLLEIRDALSELKQSVNTRNGCHDIEDRVEKCVQKLAQLLLPSTVDVAASSSENSHVFLKLENPLSVFDTPTWSPSVSRTLEDISAVKTLSGIPNKMTVPPMCISVNENAPPAPPPPPPPLPPPPPPPMPAGVFGFKKKLEINKRGLENSKQTAKSVPDMKAVLAGMKDVKLRKVERSPGGRPIKKHDKDDDSNELLNLLKRHVNNRYKAMHVEDESPADENSEQWSHDNSGTSPQTCSVMTKWNAKKLSDTPTGSFGQHLLRRRRPLELRNENYAC
ncbi:unnamed protein product [Notodromas monacha]|uniref:Uncharacterized protein n=1 Tax=Notodromas monacha TaxID=399045 RepID=A0A7R9BRQ7_9CRUS|nr:unnamed protein product [Notodromas monacha]CAG0920478.1 unnamed protein product [Notodromas monacha]